MIPIFHLGRRYPRVSAPCLLSISFLRSSAFASTMGYGQSKRTSKRLQYLITTRASIPFQHPFLRLPPLSHLLLQHLAHHLGAPSWRCKYRQLGVVGRQPGHLLALDLNHTKSGKQTSIAVLMLWSLIASGSQTPYSFISTIAPVSPFTPHELLPSACLALNSVNTRTGLFPAF